MQCVPSVLRATHFKLWIYWDVQGDPDTVDTKTYLLEDLVREYALLIGKNWDYRRGEIVEMSGKPMN